MLSFARDTLDEATHARAGRHTRSLRVVVGAGARVEREVMSSRLSEMAPLVDVAAVTPGDRSTLEALASDRTSVALVGLGLGEEPADGLALVQRIALMPRPVVAFGARAGAASVAAALGARALGFVTTTTPASVIASVLRAAESGIQLVCAAHYEQASEGDRAALARLTRRELEVLLLWVDGFDTVEIATRLGMADQTVAVHRKRIRRKVKIHNAPDLLRFVMRTGAALMSSIPPPPYTIRHRARPGASRSLDDRQAGGSLRTMLPSHPIHLHRGGVLHRSPRMSTMIAAHRVPKVGYGARRTARLGSAPPRTLAARGALRGSGQVGRGGGVSSIEQAEDTVGLVAADLVARGAADRVGANRYLLRESVFVGRDAIVGGAADRTELRYEDGLGLVLGMDGGNSSAESADDGPDRILPLGEKAHP